MKFVVEGKKKKKRKKDPFSAGDIAVFTVHRILARGISTNECKSYSITYFICRSVPCNLVIFVGRGTKATEIVNIEHRSQFRNVVFTESLSPLVGAFVEHALQRTRSTDSFINNFCLPRELNSVRSFPFSFSLRSFLSSFVVARRTKLTKLTKPTSDERSIPSGFFHLAFFHSVRLIYAINDVMCL